MHTKAFSMLEAVFVIVIIGILATLLQPNFERDSLLEASNQLITDIRYTQNLALSDHKFDNSDEFWYKRRWQILFHKQAASLDQWAYSIFSDKPSYTGNPDISELAINPMDFSRYLTGGYNSIIEHDDPRVTPTMNLGKTFGITDVQFSGCGSSAKRIAFDRAGRPIVGNLRTAIAPYESTRTMDSQCQIILTSQDGRKATILIEPESGFAKATLL